MKSHVTNGIRIAIIAVVVGLCPLLAFAQQPSTPAPKPPAIPGVASPSPLPTPETTGIQTETPDVVYGLQGVLVETLDGQTVAVQSPDEAFNPASAIKLATALVALRTLGPQHRFTTGLWTTGTFDRKTGTLHGDLYISGRDPSLHYEHAVMVSRQLNNLGIRTVMGNLIVAPGFTMNFNWSARRSGQQFYDTLDSALRSQEATRAWWYERSALGDKESLATVPSVVILGEIQVNAVAPGAKHILSHRSSTLVDILKVLLCYSNNFMAERLGDSLGGTESVTRELSTLLGITPAEFTISTLSGLGSNRVTPRAMMKIFKALRQELRKNKLSTTDIMPVAGIDPGTLQDRFTAEPWRGSVIAKTGTLIRTDGGASSLVGQMKTANGETLLFVILNQRGNVLKFRENQDFLVMQIQNSRGGPKAFEYKPHMLAMKLANTVSDVGPSNEQFEPMVKTSTTSP